MKSFYLMENSIRDYAWGHSSDIPEFLGISYPDDRPAAELWMGAHPGAPSIIIDENGKEQTLADFISADPDTVLGKETAGRFVSLPYLFKLLAAGKSLSIQAHPDKATAEDGFAKEERKGIPVDSPIRNYRDDNHKPEIIMALTTFTAMIGFRNPVAIAADFSELQNRAGVFPVASEILKKLGSGDASALEAFLEVILSAEETMVSALRKAAAGGSEEWNLLQNKWIPKLLKQFPGDIGALAPLFLNVVELQPGQALYQPARALHAYLSGFGLELMANSDNVLRGGLTPKNVDVDELLKVLDFKTGTPAVLEARIDGSGMKSFNTPAKEFVLRLAELSEEEEQELPTGTGPSIALVLDGTAVLEDSAGKLELRRGMSAFIPASAREIVLSGVCRIALAGVAE